MKYRSLREINQFEQDYPLGFVDKASFTQHMLSILPERNEEQIKQAQALRIWGIIERYSDLAPERGRTPIIYAPNLYIVNSTGECEQIESTVRYLDLDRLADMPIVGDRLNMGTIGPAYTRALVELIALNR